MMDFRAHPELMGLAFPAFWLVITTVLGLFSGWYFLMAAYPNRDEPATLRLSGLSAEVGAMRCNGILTIEVCRSGLRFRLLRLFGPFCRPFLVPWSDLQVRRTRGWFLSRAELKLGVRGTVTLAPFIADQLAAAAHENWPEKNPPPPMNAADLRRQFFLQWLAFTTVGATFFMIVPRLVGRGNGLPIAVAVLLPGVVAGIAMTIEYLKAANGLPQDSDENRRR